VSVRRIVVLLALAAVLIGGLLWYRNRARPASDQAASEPARPRPDPTQRAITPDQIPAMLRDTSWQTRLRAANALPSMDALPLDRRVGLLAEALDREVTAPASGPPFMGSYLLLTSTLRINYLRLLENLGAPASGPVRAAGKPSTPAGREWRTLALAATGSRESIPDLRGLLSSSDPAVRMTAARYLGFLKDQDAIQALKQALADPFTASTAGHGQAEARGRFYPVRQQAARALRVLGVSLKRQGDSYVLQ
jgi:HEAT repeat protein